MGWPHFFPRFSRPRWSSANPVERRTDPERSRHANDTKDQNELHDQNDSHDQNDQKDQHEQIETNGTKGKNAKDRWNASRAPARRMEALQ